jgi:hypothetical protein
MSLSVSDWLAGCALGLSLILAFIEIRRRFYVLHFEVTDERPIDKVNNTLYILIGLTIYNPSSMPKTVYLIDFQPLEKYNISELSTIQNFEESTVTFVTGGNSAKVRLDDTASFPLDIEPLHSRTVYFGVAVSPILPLPPKDSRPVGWKNYGYLVGFDYRHKQIVKILLRYPN